MAKLSIDAERDFSRFAPATKRVCPDAHLPLTSVSQALKGTGWAGKMLSGLPPTFCSLLRTIQNPVRSFLVATLLAFRRLFSTQRTAIPALSLRPCFSKPTMPNFLRPRTPSPGRPVGIFQGLSMMGLIQHNMVQVAAPTKDDHGQRDCWTLKTNHAFAIPIKWDNGGNPYALASTYTSAMLAQQFDLHMWQDRTHVQQARFVRKSIAGMVTSPETLQTAALMQAGWIVRKAGAHSQSSGSRGSKK